MNKCWLKQLKNEDYWEWAEEDEDEDMTDFSVDSYLPYYIINEYFNHNKLFFCEMKIEINRVFDDELHCIYYIDNGINKNRYYFADIDELTYELKFSHSKEYLLSSMSETQLSMCLFNTNYNQKIRKLLDNLSYEVKEDVYELMFDEDKVMEEVMKCKDTLNYILPFNFTSIKTIKGTDNIKIMDNIIFEYDYERWRRT
jgi:hypothetical protein